MTIKTYHLSNGKNISFRSAFVLFLLSLFPIIISTRELPSINASEDALVSMFLFIILYVLVFIVRVINVRVITRVVVYFVLFFYPLLFSLLIYINSISLSIDGYSQSGVAIFFFIIFESLSLIVMSLSLLFISKRDFASEI